MRVPLLRAFAIVFALALGLGAGALYLWYASALAPNAYSYLGATLLAGSTMLLGWGAALVLVGLWPGAPAHFSDAPIRGRTAILVPVCNEAPAPTFARVAAMMASLRSAPAEIHFAILSDTRDAAVAAEEAVWFTRLMAESQAEGRLFYRRREKNTGRKAGNIIDFFRRSGAAYDYALILDADSLMEPETIVEMIRRMEAAPDLGLLQTLPVVVRAQSVFGRTMQFAAGFFSPVFARGLARLAGRCGPFWGHNALVRTRAWVECCQLPELSGPPPFGGTIYSHDVVEGALLARGGWTVRLDTDLGGSYEEAPESLIEHAKRDRRWCQGNLQHSRILRAPGLPFWSRFSIFLGIATYIAPLFWAGFLVAAALDRATLPPPDYFPDPHQFFPVFPSDETAMAVGLAIGIIGLLLLPKVLILAESALTGRAKVFGGTARAFASTLADLALSSLIAPILMAFQSRSVLQVLSGFDGGWPPNRRGDARLSVAEAFEAGQFIPVLGVAGLAVTWFFVPQLLLWLLPVLLPMILAPVLIAATSLPMSRRMPFLTPAERSLPAALRHHDAILARWSHPTGGDGGTPAPVPANDTAEPRPIAAE